ncbi:MAG: hypothetical protein HUJ28_01515 [Chromatiales bacterium]|nr:hypothetical protein [Chromatiales bacterium]
MSCTLWIRRTALPLALLGVALAAPVHADVLKIEDQDPVVVQKGERPTRGMSQQRVLDQFGEPRSRHGAVGEPPISRWDYGDFSVYFEHNHVLHAVDFRQEQGAQPEAAPAR